MQSITRISFQIACSYSHGPQLPTTMSRSDTLTIPSSFTSAGESVSPHWSMTVSKSLTLTYLSPLMSAGHMGVSHTPLVHVVPSPIQIPPPASQFDCGISIHDDPTQQAPSKIGSMSTAVIQVRHALGVFVHSWASQNRPELLVDAAAPL